MGDTEDSVICERWRYRSFYKSQKDQIVRRYSVKRYKRINFRKLSLRKLVKTLFKGKPHVVSVLLYAIDASNSTSEAQKDVVSSEISLLQEINVKTN